MEQSLFFGKSDDGRLFFSASTLALRSKSFATASSTCSFVASPAFFAYFRAFTASPCAFTMASCSSTTEAGVVDSPAPKPFNSVVT